MGFKSHFAATGVMRLKDLLWPYYRRGNTTPPTKFPVRVIEVDYLASPEERAQGEMDRVNVIDGARVTQTARDDGSFITSRYRVASCIPITEAAEAWEDYLRGSRFEQK